MAEDPLRPPHWLRPRNARLALAAIALVSGIMLLALRQVRFDYDFEKFFPLNDPELDRYEAFRERFGHDNDHVLFGIDAPEGRTVFDRELLVRVDSMAARLERLPHTLSVLSPTRMEEPIITPAGVFNTPWLRFNEGREILAIDSARIHADPRMREHFFSPDSKAMLVLLTAEPGLSKVRTDSLVNAVRAVVDGSGLLERADGRPGVRVAGRIFGQEHYIERMIHETVLFLAVSIAMLAVFLWFGFRTWRGVVVPIAVVGFAILWQVGLMTLLGQPLSILTMLLPTILFVVGMSDVVHILEYYLDEVRKGTPRLTAIAATYREVGLPTFLTALTSGIGFATLGTASIQPLQEFGLFTGIGVLVAFLLAFTLLPALLVLTEPLRLLPVAASASPWDARLPDLFRWTIRHRKGILIGFGLVIVAGGLLATRIKTNNYLLEDLPEHDPHKQDFLWFEEHFGGVRPFEVEVSMSDTTRTIWHPSVLRQIAAVQDHLEQAYGVHNVLSPVTLMRSMNKAYNGGSSEFYKLPEDSAECMRLARNAKLLGKQQLASLVSADGHMARISGRMVDEGGYVHKGKNEALDRFIAQHTDAATVQFHQTGMAWLIDRNNASLSAQLVRGMGIAVLFTALIMLWFFRDWRMVFVALIPNLVPLVFIAGVMGAVGIDLKVSTAIIFTIAFGIAEDDTIHMLASLRLHLRNGLSPAYALKRTYLSTGKAVTVTSLMLLSGFVTLVFSDFASVYYMGLLITLTLAFAFVAELLLLPALVMTMMPRRRK